MASVTKILVASDFSDHAERALVLALELAKSLGASVTVVHAYEIPVYSVPDATLVPPPVYAAGIANAAQTCIDTTVERFSGRGAEITGVLREGPAAREIAALADELDVGMIVIGTHGRSGIARAILGSVAERVIRIAHRPVLAVPPPKSP
jgi:nucleotide-binding universal stress UspA family protein